ncbi:unnamed protein product [Miscanthus lutarioriparius]|uniref:Uncharacterized protein n=1 Tax=Miscanthus lutarioriparius TaxID=422564 RepID=A0A811Q450_9POAL|nr:unnamed protein product [Miscanthus lutarioriparius]
MGEKQAKDAAAVAAGAGDQDDGTAPAPPLDGIQYCSEHPYRPATAAAAAAVAGGGICAFCLQEKLGRLVSSSKSSPFFPLGGHPPPSGSPSSPPSFRRATEPLAPPLHPSGGASRKFMSFHRKKTPSSSSSSAAVSVGGGGLKRSKSVAPRPELEQFPYSSASSASLAAESPRKKSFWSFLSLTSSAYAHQAAASTPYATNAGGAVALRGLRQPQLLRDFLERLSNGFGDCTLRRVESHREPKPHKMHGGGGLHHLGGAGANDDDGEEDDVYEHQHRIKCAGFFGALGPASSSYWLSAAECASVSSGSKRSSGRSHRSWAWALASPMRGAAADDDLHLHQDHHRGAGQPRDRPRQLLGVGIVHTIPGATTVVVVRGKSSGSSSGGELKFGAGTWPVNHPHLVELPRIDLVLSPPSRS